jgi:hypothetical protein
MNAGQTVPVGINASKVCITKIKIDKDRKQLLQRKDRTSLSEKGKGKYSGADIDMRNVD